MKYGTVRLTIPPKEQKKFEIFVVKSLPHQPYFVDSEVVKTFIKGGLFDVYLPVDAADMCGEICVCILKKGSYNRDHLFVPIRFLKKAVHHGDYIREEWAGIKRNYPHECPHCGNPAYIGCMELDCFMRCHNGLDIHDGSSWSLPRLNEPSKDEEYDGEFEVSF
jgi:hypothetical protein